jgi:peptidyl-prolyl cis-trans isomerase B (cyclophilin B)
VRSLSWPAVRRLLALPLAVAVLGLAACGSSSNDATTASGASGGSGGAGGASAPAQAPATTEAAPAASSGGCKQVAAPKPRSGKTSKPTAPLADGKAWTVRLSTSCGTIDIRLDTRRDPKTAANFGTLAKRGYYDGLGFHRVVPGFVIQGGDPAGDGSGGPGYTVVEAPPKGTAYSRGVVAMAKTASDPAGASGSQFFIVTGADAGLPPDYAVAGRVTHGLATVDRIAALGRQGADGPPSQPVVISKATLRAG